MSFARRLTLAFSGQLERLVGEIENHDAVIAAGIRESRGLYAQARVRHARLQQDGEHLRRRLAQARDGAVAWRARALACDATPVGEDKALQCLQRARRLTSQAAELEEHLRQHRAVAAKVAAELDALRQRVESLEHKRGLLRAREATSLAAARIGARDQDLFTELDERFERWEIRLTEAELAVTLPLTDADPLAVEIGLAEERAALVAELAALRSEQTPRHGGEQ